MLGGLPELPESLNEAIANLTQALDLPLRVAVVGRIKSGKSTVVNALLGQKVAATDAGECTRIVSRFDFGFPESAVLHLEDGSRTRLPFDSGTLGTDFPKTSSPPVAVQVTLSNEFLRSVTVIDTPGLGSAHVEISQATTDYLTPHPGAGSILAADAVLFVLTGRLVVEELESLREMMNGFASELGLAVTALGLLTQLDHFAGIDTYESDVRERCESHATALRGYVSDVVPIAGLIAETAAAGLFSERDAHAIGTLAEQGDDVLETWLLSVERFRTKAICISEESRERLLELLGLYGIRFAIANHRQGKHGAAALTAELAKHSGVEPLRRRLLTELRIHADALRAASALRALEQLTFNQHNAEWDSATALLRDEVERLRLSPLMHTLNEREVHHGVASGLVAFAPPWREEALRMTAAGQAWERLGVEPDSSRQDMALAARRGVARWREYAYICGNPELEAAAGTVIRTYELLYRSLNEAPMEVDVL